MAFLAGFNVFSSVSSQAHGRAQKKCAKEKIVSRTYLMLSKGFDFCIGVSQIGHRLEVARYLTMHDLQTKESGEERRTGDGNDGAISDELACERGAARGDVSTYTNVGLHSL